jgi:hypothetical protein
VPSPARIASLLVAAIVASVTAWGATPEPRPDWARALAGIGGWLDPAATNPPVVSCRLHLTEATGFPAGYVGSAVDVMLQAPDRCRLGWGTNRTRVEFGRAGPRLWLWEASSGRVYVAPVANAADGLRPSVGIPVPPAVLRWMPTACDATNLPDVSVAGQPCAATRIRPRRAARDWLGVDDFRITVWLRYSDGLPQAIRWQVPADQLALTLWPSGLRTDRPLPPAKWQPPATPGGRTTSTSSTGLMRRLPSVVGFLATEFGAVPPELPEH